MKFIKVVIPIAIVLLGVWLIIGFLVATKPKPEKRSRPSMPPTVNVIEVKPGTYQIVIPTRGEVRARTRSVLIPEVPGRITAVSPSFRDGGFFEKGDILVEIDPRDYQTAVTVAASNVAEAKNAFEQETARAAQARENWERLGKGTPANDLVLRVPQLAEAKARVEAATAQLDKATIDLGRTKIKAPYPGRIREQLVDVGQFVNTGTSLARIFAVDFAEIRLPLTNRQQAFIDLPEDFRGESSDQNPEELPSVTLTKKQGNRELIWNGRVVRTEGAIDRSRQLFVIAQIEDPYRKREDDQPPLKVGDFVEAKITGRLLENVYTIPRTAIREGDKVLAVDGEERLRFRQANVIWGDKLNVVVDQGLKPGDTICTTPPAYATEGAKVTPSTPGGGKPGRPPGKKPRGEKTS